ncbi:DUF4034 domain-containing protein [Luteolibacter sp. SL250]|uniref:DUF4034 domain-containing protein n=1 Tax=Luteolibacter sp. SL250 TaxID=2995170 RepID=UPI0022722741|nr:DUF4034 domain-containing protein [Luteolibacter sp. SL250]WAC21326.1 DUF4034 domain-containing protein [Luteolibacter sp. SL250]
MNSLRFLCPAALLWICLFVDSSGQGKDADKLKRMNARTLEAKELPETVGWLEDTEGKVKERATRALLAGPEALEELAQQLRRNEMKDKDGRYTTPYFYRQIALGGDPIRGEKRRAYQKRVFGEWLEKFPRSEAAMLAQARLHAELANDTRLIPNGKDVEGTKWIRMRRDLEASAAFLEKSSALRSVDPAWMNTYFVTVDQLGDDTDGLERGTVELIRKFPDCGYVLSRAVLNRVDRREPDERENLAPWLKRHLDTLPPDTAAKLYALTYAGFGNHRGYSAARGYLPLERERMLKGLELLAAEYPDSIVIATQEVALRCWVLEDRAGALAALKRAGNILDVEFMVGTKDGYKIAVSFIRSTPWNPQEMGVPAFSGYFSETPPDRGTIMRKACAAGPAALEELIKKIRSESPLDQHGNSNAARFFSWFNVKETNLYTAELRLAHADLLERWRKEYPASPDAQLASARYWISRAWDARGTTYANEVGENQWKGFAEGLAQARKHLTAAKELQRTDPAWTDVALDLLLGEGDPNDEFEDITDVMFSHFPECPQTLGGALYSFRPKWGGKAGAWEPWVREKTKALPEDVRARTYAQAVIMDAGYAFFSKENEKEIFGGKKPDMDLLWKGIASLREKHPDSIRYPSAEAMFHCKYSGKAALALKEIKKLDGKVDLRVWYRYDYYERCTNWLAWKLME